MQASRPRRKRSGISGDHTGEDVNRSPSRAKNGKPPSTIWSFWQATAPLTSTNWTISISEVPGDTSALVRIMRRQVDPRWREQASRGLIAICEPVLTETLTIADTKHYERIEADITTIYPWVPIPDKAWELIRATRRELAKHSVHNALSVADYLVAVTAIQLKLTVLHEDNDFRTVAGIIPQLDEYRISDGPPKD